MRAVPAYAALAGAAVMALEILGSRALAPGFGATLETWAVLIAVTLAAGSAGAALGARLAVRASRARVATAFLAASLASGLSAAGAPALVQALLGWPLTPGAFAASAALVAPPVFALSLLLPLLVALSAPGDAALAGRTTGRILAASTAGSLVGTLGTAFLLAPALGLRRSGLILAGLLGMAAWSAGRGGLRRGAAAALLAVLLLAVREAPSDAGVIRRETPYGELVLRRAADGITLRANGIVQGRDTGWPATCRDLVAQGQHVGLLPYLHPRGREALEIGLGTGALKRSLAAHGISTTTIEIDVHLVELVREALGDPGPVIPGDGRAVLRRLDRSFDFIILDAFRGEAMPGHLLTQESFREMRSRLRPGGILALHLIGMPDSRAVGAVARTLAAEFAEVLSLKAREGTGLMDIVLFAAEAPLPLPAHGDLPPLDALSARVFRPAVDGVPLLSDDRNPVEILAGPQARALRRASR
jgi:SAM-dependent methyltransferase